jgi:hypothetical protein
MLVQRRAVVCVNGSLLELLAGLVDLAKPVVHPAQAIKEAAVERLDAYSLFDQPERF